MYLRQEGRGTGLINKIRAYGLKDYGYDTVKANLALGFRDDERECRAAVHVRDSLKVKSIRIMTNKSKKINELAAYGIKISGRLLLTIPPNPSVEFYQRTKAAKTGHMLSFGEDVWLLEQIDHPIVDGMTSEQIGAPMQGEDLVHGG